MLLGEYQHNIDEKGRLIIPTKFREELKTNFIITKGLEKCLCIYTMDSWQRLVKDISNLSFAKKDVRTFKRFFFANASECELDKSGRINIATSLINYALLKKECMVIGVYDHVEIWDKEVYIELMDSNSEVISDITENLFEGAKDETL